MDVPAFHQAEHLACQAAHLKSFAIKRAGERIQCPHDIGNRPESVQIGMFGHGRFRLGQHFRIRLLHHLLAKVDAHQIVLENIVIEHVLGGLAEIHNPFGNVGRPDAERHILRIRRASGVIVSANAADPAGDEVCITRIFAFHENAVATEDRGCAVAFGNFPIIEIDLREDSETADDPGDRIPIHFDEIARFAFDFRFRRRDSTHFLCAPFFLIA